MPPPPSLPLLASGFRGYVCRPCLLKLREPPKRPRTPWLYRSISNQPKPTTPKRGPTTQGQGGDYTRGAHLEEESSVRYFEEAPDGTQREVLRDDDEETLKETLSSFRNLENQSGISPQDFMDALEGSTNILDPPGSMSSLSGDGLDIGPGALAALELQNEQLRLQIQRLRNQPTSEGGSSKDLLSLFKPIVTHETTSLESNLSNGSTSLEGLREPPLKGAAFATLTKEGTTPRERHPMVAQDSSILQIAKFPRDYQSKVQTMQEALEVALSPPRRRKPGKFNTRQYSPSAKLWKDYLLCRPALLSLPQECPSAFWAKLWKAFESNNVRNLDRMVHLKTVGDDMLKCGSRMDPTQRILYIESIFLHGDQVEAIRDWKVVERIKWNDTNLFKEYQELGLRMFCITKQIPLALKAAEEIVKTAQEIANYRVFIPIISACLSIEEGPDVRQAWVLYERLRLNLGGAMTMEDYDAVTSLFLEANQPDLALRIFTDMMLTEQTLTPPQTVALLDYTVVRSNEPVPRKQESPRLNWEDSRALAKLPSKFNNRHFFGSWTKKLIGAGELDSVKKVFDLMQDRGICPSSIHMNGLIGAWIREGTEKSRIMAEELAWKMIRSRVDFVQERSRLPENNSLIRAVNTVNKPNNKSLLLIPLATMETFTILIQQYRRRQKYELFGDLFDALEQTRIPVDTRFMNELLWIDTKGHHKGWVWKTYQHLMESRAARPDFTTYAILWQNMKKQEDPVVGKKATSGPSNFTTCRRLFADMIKRTLPLRKEKDMPRELYDLIVLCFNYSQDLPATAVALRALQEHFNMFPNVQTARSMILQLARLGLVVPQGGNPRLLGYPSAKERIAEVTKVLEILKQRRIETLQEKGVIYEDMDDRGKQEEALMLLLDLLRYAYDSRKGLFESSSLNVASKAAQEMDVSDCKPWV